ncbi:MAG TPA: HAD-IA family hydrolase [Candidatus Corynebacterium avicola]|uniref:HAD-IA family hydrolase n=1 Tax=Candidatus Corynebacterium avicola TaxID=2838527 RepID=A0A9D1RRT1_9CORY|nr:HAD-IA family hydrolase [Candidatus Corynebacterium avicola]
MTESPDLTGYQAVLFDLDGVITPTADLHRQAWAVMFTDYLDSRGAEPYTEQDYYDHLDGRARLEGIASLLESRGISLPMDGPDGDDQDTVTSLGERKNNDFLRLLDEGITAYPGSVALLDALAGSPNPPRVAIVSSSKNARQVLEAAGLLERFELVVDGRVAAEHQLPGKPAPDTYAYAATQLGVENSAAVVVEDATSGVASGRAGAFGLTVGVDRGAGQDALLAAGADVVVSDLEELVRADWATT